MFKDTTGGKRSIALPFQMPKATKSRLKQSNLTDKKVCTLAHLKQSNLNVARTSYQCADILIISIYLQQCV